MAEFGYGQQTPWDTGDDSTLAAFITRQMMARMSTMKLVRVEAVHGNGEVGAPGTVDVLPLVSQIDGNNNATPHGTVHGIPWARMQSGAAGIISDPKVGDIGMIVCADRDISGVKASKKPSTPGSFRKFDLADGVYVGAVLGAMPNKYILFADDRIEVLAADKVSLKCGTAHVTLTPSSAVIEFGAHNITIDASGIHLNGPTFLSGLVSGTTTGAGINFGTAPLATTGAVTAGAGTNLSTHVHPGVATGGGTTGPPV